jgi:DUF971 family protein
MLPSASVKETYPVEVRRLADQRRLRVTWSDGHVGSYDYDLLRGYCPCAGCQGHAARSLTYHPPDQPVLPEGIEAVGNYALSFRWSDGHATGIYRFDLLRWLCPCPQCRGIAGDERHGETR